MSNRPSDPSFEGATPSPGALGLARAPSVNVSTIGATVQPILGEKATVEDFRVAFLTAFGTTELVIAEALFGQLLNILHTEPAKPLDDATANLVLALLHRIRPRDELEAMLACQMIAVHVATMDATRRALHIQQTAAGRSAYLALARKLMNTFALQLEALGRHRGRPTVQKVVVEKILVAPGGQAVVGAVANGGPGDGR